MAIHKVNVYENTGATKAKAPFLGRYLSNGTVTLDDYIEDLAEEAGHKEIQDRAILEGAFAAITKQNNDEGPTRFHLPGGLSTYVNITGTVASANSALTSANTIEQCIRLDSSIRNELVNETPALQSGEDVTKVRFDRVFDTEVQKPQSVIYGTRAARAQGMNLVMTDVGASIRGVDGKGINYACSLIEQVSSQEFTFKFTNPPAEGCDLWIEIETRGGNEDGNLQTVRKPVKFIVLPAKITAVKDEDGNSQPTYGKGGEIDGERLPATFTDDDLVKLYENGVSTGGVSMKQLYDDAVFTSVAEDKIVFNDHFWTPFSTPDPAKNYEVEIILGKTKARVALTVPLPTITKTYTEGHEYDSKWSANPHYVYIKGTGLGGLSKEQISFKCLTDTFTIPADATWTFADNLVTIYSENSTVQTGGTSGDSITVTITAEGLEPIVSTTSIA